ncbi:MAG: winged helix-turn-helix transcriptional regulator, partial [Proteobacteria bacterium]|nr:winged helix-turn-helix transcriptional regulator [Pseudomonadota bacterium]
MKSSAQSTRHEILRELKMRSGASQAELAEHFGISREAVRQQMVQLELLGWVRNETRESQGRGRPAQRWVLTPEGE